jgi:hypothetical protein
MKKMKFLLGIISIMGILFFTACQDMDNLSDKKGNLVIKITDAPFPFHMIDAATVYINKVEIRKKSEGEELGYPYFTVYEVEEGEDPLEFNLLDLQNGITADLVDMEIEAGNYDLIRLYVEKATLAVKDGETYTMKVPSGAQTGIKVFVEPDIRVGGGLNATYLLLDFSVEKSFVLKGNANSPAGIKGFNFKPVIRAVNMSTAGSIEGMVTNSDTALENAYVLLEQVVDLDTFEITSASADETGYYAMPGIPAGLYNISATLEEFDTVIVEGLEVIEGNLTVQDFVLTKLEVEEEGTTTTEE